MAKLLITILLSQWFVLNAQTDCSLNSDCTTLGGNPGRCVPLKNCTEYDLRLAISGSIQGQLNDSHTGCCPKLRSDPDCGAMKLQDHIFGGDETDRDEFAWLAIVMVTNPSSGEPVFKCGGTLINDRYVVTAAHCVRQIKYDKLLIRLGAWDLGVVEADVQDFRAAAIFIHEKYVRRGVREYDIALIKLDQDAPRTEFIEPICLPTQADYHLDLEMPFFVSGWGMTETEIISQRKMKVKLPAKNLNDCQQIYHQLKAVFTENQLCIGGISGMDSCSGDSGGPLMTEINYRAYLVGIVSWGLVLCGQENAPSIYTRFDKYLDWVAARIEEGIGK